MSKVRMLKGDCLEKMKLIEDGSVDLILCDLPYGTTPIAWDSVIDPRKLWAEYERVLKPTGTALLFGAQPFTSQLVNSNLKLFKYTLIWQKLRPANFAQARNMPLKNFEDIVVFSKGVINHKGKTKKRMTYQPQGVRDIEPSNIRFKRTQSESSFTMRPSHTKGYRLTRTGYPMAILKFGHDKGGLHPTQKPVALLEYLVKTYSRKGEVVLDNCMGSGSTGVACWRTGRRFIGIELKDKYFTIAVKRMKRITTGGQDFTSKEDEHRVLKEKKIREEAKKSLRVGSLF